LRKAIDAHRQRHQPPAPDFISGEMHGSGAMPSHDVPCLVATCAATSVLAVLAILALGSNTRPGLVPRCRSQPFVLHLLFLSRRTHLPAPLSGQSSLRACLQLFQVQFTNIANVSHWSKSSRTILPPV
jgi:hypothetical protein